MYGVPEDILKQYNINTVKVSRARDVYMIHTDKGMRCLKKINIKKDQIIFINEVKNYLWHNKFNNIDNFEISRQGLPYAEVNNGIYVITNWIEGHECDFSNAIDQSKAVDTLAIFHKTMNGFKLNEQYKHLHSNLGNWPEEFQKKIYEMVRLSKEAKKYKTSFDEVYQKNLSYFLYMAKTALLMLSESSYTKLVEAPEHKNSFCHKDYTYHNIIISDDGRGFIIDFDYCGFDLSVYDLTNFIIKNMKKTNWDADVAKRLLYRYDKINPISNEEYEIIKILFIFPQKFWKIANRYYNKRHKHMDMNLYNKLCEEVMQKQFKDEFLRKMNYL